MSSKRAVLYARVSGDDYDDDEKSKLDAQLAECRKYAEKKQYKVLHELKEDTFSSGADSDLPQLARVLQLARDDMFDVLVVREIDRLARDVHKYMDIKSKLKVNGVSIEFVVREYADDWRGGFMETLDAAWAAAERAQIVERTRRGKRNSVKAGNVTCCGAPPYGYREATVDGKRTLVVDEEEAEIVRMMYRLYIQGNSKGEKYGCKAIAKSLTDRKIPSHSDKGNAINSKVVSEYGYWSHMDVSRMLKAPVYKGEWQYGKRTDDPITIPVPRIVTDEDWEAAQVIRKKNRLVRKYPGDYDFLLKGMATCSVCGRSLELNSCRKKNEPPQYYYKHRTVSRQRSANGSACLGHGYFRAKDVDSLIWQCTSEYLANPKILVDAFEEYCDEVKAQDSPVRDKLKTHKKKIARTERDLDKLLQEYLDDELPKARYRKKKHVLEANMERYRMEVGNLEREMHQADALEEYMKTTTEFIATAHNKLQSVQDTSDKRELIKRLGLNVELSRQGDKKCADAVFSLPTIPNAEEHATYSVFQITEN